MKDKIRSVLDEFYNVNMFNDSVRDHIASEIEKVLTGKTSIDPLSKPTEVKLTPIKKPVENKKEKSLPKKSKPIISKNSQSVGGLKKLGKKGVSSGRSRPKTKKRA